MSEPVSRAKLPIRAILRPFQTFFRLEAASGVVLLACTVVALVWANSPASASYFSLWETKLTLGTAQVGLSKSLIHWINDALMAVFFLLVGLEIKREVLFGELSSRKGAALPIMGALGGMIVPAGIYVAITMAQGTPEARRGWAVPMATDIAFALGILALLGKRAPAGLKIFLAALAIADDLAAVLVIAVFYTSKLSLVALACAAGCLAVLVIGNRFGIRRTVFYALIGVILWVAVYKSGVHATIAGVLLAMTIPARGRAEQTALAEAASPSHDANRSPDQQHAVSALEYGSEPVVQPLQRWEHALHPWVAFGIMPLFALANAGVAIDAASARGGATDAASIGTFLGLFLGKQLGVFAFAWLAVKVGLARLPSHTTWPQLYGVACLCGIGFTMSLFIGGLAFTSPQVLDHAKLAILGASTLSALIGALLLIMTRNRAAAAPSVGQHP